MKIWIVLIAGLLLGSAYAQTAKSKKVYKYRKFEKFDFDNIDISGDNSGIQDLSVTTRFQRKFRNRLPYKKNFNKEIRKAIETIR